MKKDYQNEIEKLDELAFNVTQKDYTEAPFTNEYDEKFEDGIYVDIVSKAVLFSSLDKFDSGCGWPAFTKPVNNEDVVEKLDQSQKFRPRTEIRSTEANSHLGHVFNDGPADQGGLRYCINSAALLFIPKAKMDESGYAEYLHLFEK